MMKIRFQPILHILYFLLIAARLMGQGTVSSDSTTVDQFKESEIQSSVNESGSVFGLSKEGLLVYGAHLFQGDFRDLSFSGFNPDYLLSAGDEIQVMVWGALQQQLTLHVDLQGNIFIPEVGPIKVLGVRNADLNEVIRQQVKRVFSNNVEVYANLATAQTVKVFVSGYVERPGLFEGYASDSILFYLDKAGGVDLDRGSFIDVTIKRRGQTVQSINLYDFLSNGEMDLVQFQDGDSIFVGSLHHTVNVKGEVSNPARFEFDQNEVPLSELMRLASPEASATNVSVVRKSNGQSDAFYFALGEASGFMILPDDVVSFTSSSKPNSILISVTGAHVGDDHQVLPYGALLSDALERIQPNSRSDLKSVQLFRESVALRQKQLLNQMLDNLERTVLNARSDSVDEAALRLNESEMILKFVERARSIQPKGQVLLDSSSGARDIYLEDGDVLYIPPTSKLVTVYGEVKFPNTQVYDAKSNLREYIHRAGGFTDNANKDEIILIRRNGLVENVGSARRVEPQPGDEIFVLPKPDGKHLQMAKDVSTIVYQVAIAARVVIGL